MCVMQAAYAKRYILEYFAMRQRVCVLSLCLGEKDSEPLTRYEVLLFLK